MIQKPLDMNQQHTILKTVREGMEVYDSQGDKIGTVDDLYFGASTDEQNKYGVGAATAPDPSLRDDTLVDNIAEGIFGADDLPEEMRARLVNHGYIRIDAANLFGSDRYALPEQIDRVQNDHVHLNVRRSQLLKK